jgi:CRISPR system Cascade subunit CasB
MPQLELDEKVEKFLQNLSALDAGGKARLKRDAGKPLAEAQSLGLFYRLLPYGLSATQEEIFFLLATLYPLADEEDNGNFGDSLRSARDLDPKKNKGLDRRVEVLLDSNMAQLSFRLRQAVRLLKSKQVAVNWRQLLDDLLRWNYVNRAVQKRWARAYFGISEPIAGEVASPEGEAEPA